MERWTSKTRRRHLQFRWWTQRLWLYTQGDPCIKSSLHGLGRAWDLQTWQAGFAAQEGSITYREWVPNAKQVFLIGDFNKWENTTPLENEAFFHVDASFFGCRMVPYLSSCTCSVTFHGFSSFQIKCLVHRHTNQTSGLWPMGRDPERWKRWQACHPSQVSSQSELLVRWTILKTVLAVSLKQT